MWEDLEKGIIRQGSRANINDYKVNNPFRRIGLDITVDANATLLQSKLQALTIQQEL